MKIDNESIIKIINCIGTIGCFRHSIRAKLYKNDKYEDKDFIFKNHNQLILALKRLNNFSFDYVSSNCIAFKNDKDDYFFILEKFEIEYTKEIIL